MSESRFERIQRLFDELVELDPAAREGRLDEACADDPEVRREVEALLEQDARGDERIDRAIREAAASVDDGESLVGRTVGPFRVLELVGTGGFGSVYVAEQTEPIERRVALKVIRTGMATAEVVARFEAERQTLARMDHPGIARVFDAGRTESGHPYFTMELVDGTPLIEYCDSRRLGIGARLALFVQVTRAVQHAHQKGVLHRDLKPGNILVTESDGRPVCKVIDFGIAKAIHPDTPGPELTRTMQLIGTPEYMSPEQADPSGRDVDTRSDIYSLGTVLYELLTGSTPFSSAGLRRAGLEEVLRVLREDDPPRPSECMSGELDEGVAAARDSQRLSLSRALRGDLDWIVMKALEKEPARRYDSVGALGDDVERHLRDEPVVAGPPSVGYRLGKFVRRNRVTVVAAGLVVVALAVGLAAALAGLGRARAERARALEAEAAQRVEAETARQVADFLVDLFSVSIPERPGGGDVTARELLDAGAERIEVDLASQPEVRARLLTVLGEVYLSMDVHDRARALIDEGYGIRRELHTGDHDDLVHSLLALGGISYDEGDMDAAGEHYAAALAMARRLHGESGALTAEAYVGTATVHRFLNELAATEDALRRALQILRARTRSGTVDPAAIAVRGRLAGVLMAQGRAEEAEEAFREQIADCTALYGEEHACTAEAMSDLAVLVKNRGAYDEAEPLYRRTLEIRRAIYGEDHTLVAQSLNNFSAFHRAAGHPEAALRYAREAVATYERVLGDAPSTAFGLHTLARALMMDGRHEEALAEARRARRILADSVGESYWVTGYVRSTIGQCLAELGRLDEAETEQQAALAGLEAALGPDHRHTRVAAERLAALNGSD